jgi:hypothetical protein
MIVQIVKIALIVYGLLACAFIILLWRNASAPDALKNTGVVIASILPIALLVLPYLNSETIEKRYTYMLLFDSKRKTLIWGQEPNLYHSAYIPMFANLGGLNNALTSNSWTEVMDTNGVDLIERGVLEALQRKFSASWDLASVSKFKGPGFQSEQFTFTDTSSNRTEIALTQLQTIFTHNRIITHPGVVVFPNLILPPDSTIQTEQTGHERTIKISNSKLSVQIRITRQMGGPQQQGIWGVQPPDPEDMNRYTGMFYGVSVIGKIGSTWVYSPEMTAYRRWFDNISDVLSTYDWEKIDHDIHDYVFRKSMSKILDP